MSKYCQEVNKCLLKLQRKDMSQVEKLAELTTNHLIGVAKSYLVNKDNAEDVVADTFIKIIRYIDSFDNSKDGYNWMLKIVENIAIDYNKRDAKITLANAKIAENSKRIVSDIEADNDKLDFCLALDNLDPTDQFVAYRRFYLDEPLEVIGKYLGISKVAVYRRVKKICGILENFYKNR